VRRSIGAIYVAKAVDTKREYKGSAVVVGRTEVITACHVIDESISDTYTVNFNGYIFLAYRDFDDEERDLCLLSVPGLANNHIAVPVGIGSSHGLSTGDEVYAASVRADPLQSFSAVHVFSAGNVYRLRTTYRPNNKTVSVGGDPTGGRIIEFDAKIWFGSSGGGLFNSNGELVGITTEINNAALIGIAFPVEWVIALIERKEEWKRRESQDYTGFLGD